jgi:hypothetical protein
MPNGAILGNAKRSSFHTSNSRKIFGGEHICSSFLEMAKSEEPFDVECCEWENQGIGEVLKNL